MRLTFKLQRLFIVVGVVAIAMTLVNRLCIKPPNVKAIESRLSALGNPSRELVRKTFVELVGCPPADLIEPSQTILAYEVWKLSSSYQIVVYYESTNLSDRDRKMLSFQSISLLDRIAVGAFWKGQCRGGG